MDLNQPDPLFYLIAGEASGDALGARLMRGLKKELGNRVRFRGVGGPQMIAEGLDLVFPHTELMHFGIAEVIRHIPSLLRRIDEAANDIIATKPTALITIDVPDFSFRVAKRVHKRASHTIPLIHYVAPTVWAWRPGRAAKIAKFLDHLLVLLPFEPPYFTRVGLDCTFVGHPIVETEAAKGDANKFRASYGIASETPLLTVLPGSRNGEANRLLPIFRETVSLLRTRHPNLELIIPTVPHLKPLIFQEVENWGLRTHIVEGEDQKYDALAASKAALACSGTVALELALARLPSIIAYKIFAPCRALWKHFVNVRFANIVNIMNDSEVVPEFLLEKCTPQNLAPAIDLLLSDEKSRRTQIDKLSATAAWLGQGEFIPSERAAQSVLAAVKKFHAPTILQVLPALVTGGVERGTVEITGALAKAGFNPVVASSGGPMVDEITAAGGTHIVLPLKSKNPVTMLVNVGRLVCLMKRRKISIVHARSRAPAWSAYAACKRTGTPFMTTIHAPYSAGNAVKRLYNSVMAKGTRVIAISNFIADYAIRTYDVAKDILRIIPRGVDIETFDRAKVELVRMDVLRRIWNLPQGVPVILMPGRITRWKGQAVLLEALAKLKSQNFACAIVGGGKDTAYGRELTESINNLGLRNKVHIFDTCRDMAAAYALADIVISPSTRPEGFGRTVIEAQSMGCAVIASNHGGAAETIIDGQTGWLVPPSDVEALAQVIKKVLDRPESERAAAALRAVTHIRNRYTVHEMSERTLAVYRELLEKK